MLMAKKASGRQREKQGRIEIGPDACNKDDSSESACETAKRQLG